MVFYHSTKFGPGSKREKRKQEVLEHKPFLFGAKTAFMDLSPKREGFVLMHLWHYLKLLANPPAVEGMFHHALIKLKDEFSLHYANDSLTCLISGNQNYSKLS